LEENRWQWQRAALTQGFPSMMTELIVLLHIMSQCVTIIIVFRIVCVED
jgi:hypothetical protein